MESEKLSFSCPACQSVLRVATELAGVRVRAQVVTSRLWLRCPPPIRLRRCPPHRPTRPNWRWLRHRLRRLSNSIPSPIQVPVPQALTPSPGAGASTSVAETESIVWPPQPRPAGDRPPEAKADSPAETNPNPIDAEPEASLPVAQAETWETYGNDAEDLAELATDLPVTALTDDEEYLQDALAGEQEGADQRNSLSRFALSHPALVRFGVPSLALAMTAVCAIKFWPSGAVGIDGEAPPLITTPAAPPSPALVDDSAGYRFTGEPSANVQPVAPAPDSRFRPDPVLSTNAIESFIDETTSDEESPEDAGAPPLASGQDEAITREPEREPSSADQARAVLEQALASDSVEGLADLVLSPRARPGKDGGHTMASRSPALTSTSIIFETTAPLPDSKFSNHTFFVSTTAQPIRFPVAIEDTADGLKLDWESFIELHDDSLGKFLAKPQSESAEFHVILERRHYFETDVPKLGSKDCFRISTPIPGSESYAFADKDSPAAKACEPFEWDRLVLPGRNPPLDTTSRR